MKKLLSLFLLVLVGCATPVSVSKYTEEQFAPTQEVQVLSTQTPIRPYKEIAKLEVKNSENAVSQLAEKAKELGADAIILTGEKFKGELIFPMGGPGMLAYGTEQFTNLTAIAIKYTG